MCAMVNLDDAYRDKLRAVATSQGVSMAAILRAAIDNLLANPPEITSTADARARGSWFVTVYVWHDESLEHTHRARVASTGALPALAELACVEAGAPADGVAEYVRAELGRFRQNLARAQSSTLRAAFELWACQIDVHRSAPEGWTP